MALDAAQLQASGVSPASASLLAAQGVDSMQTVAELDDTAWAHLYASGLRISEAIALRAMANAATPPPKMPPPASANLPLNVMAILAGVAFALPPLAIGVINEYGPFDATRALDNTTRFLVVFVPGAAYLLGSVVFIERYRTIFSTDVLQQRSVDCSLRDAIKSNLTSLAIVGALLLTIVIAMEQVDIPLEEETALLAQWYQVFLLAALVPCFSAVIQASLLLIYLDPLDEAATVAFVGNFIDYCGEPSFAIVFGILNFMPAMDLWLFGRYGFPAGCLATLATALLLRKIALSISYFSRWENVTLDAALRAERLNEKRLLIAESRKVQGLPQRQ